MLKFFTIKPKTLLFILFCYVMSYFFQIAYTSGISMYPTLSNHNVFIISPNYYKYFEMEIGDIVFCDAVGKHLCKRIIKIDGFKVWVEGDNKSMSLDSRNFGWIDVTQVRAKLLYVLWRY